MPNDAKLGLAVGVGLVIAFAVVYFRTEANSATIDPAATIIQSDQGETPAPTMSNNSRRTPTTSTARVEGDVPAAVVSRQKPAKVDRPETNEQP